MSNSSYSNSSFLDLSSDVSSPKHYNTGDVECIEAIKASMSSEEFSGYLKGAALKYLWRYRYKNKPLQDLQKSIWYTTRLIKELETTENGNLRPADRSSADTTSREIPGDK